MDTNKVWGIILIVLGVIFTLWGIGSVYNAYSVSSQMSQLGGLLGGTKMMDAMAPSKMPGLILIVVGVAAAFFGNRMLKKVRV